MSILVPGKGWLRFVPKPLRSLVQSTIDPLRGRLIWLEQVPDRLRSSRIAATWRFLRHVVSTTLARRRSRLDSITVDATPLWGTRTGIGWYLHRLLTELAARDDLELRLYGPRIFIDPGAPVPAVELPRGRAIDLVRYLVPDDLIIERAWLIRRIRRLEPFLIAAARSRVVFAPNFFPPHTFRFVRGVLVATVHDLTFKNFPWTQHEDTYRSHALQLDRTLERARLVLTDSEAVRAELVSGGCRAESVRAIPLGPGHLTAFGGELPPAIPARYALHVGTFEPRKNLPMLLEAWKHLHDGKRVVLPLVLCGAAGWRRTELDALLAEGQSAGWLINLGYAPEEVLAALYRKALLVCCPSLYEGFGFPLLEAMSAGAPVLASDIAVHREVAGDAAVFVKPDSPSQWASEVFALAHDDERRRDLAERGRRQAAGFSWQKTAGKTAAALLEAAGR